MKLLFILPYAYPHGSASAALIQRLALGFRDNGIASEILCFEKNPEQPEQWREDSWGIPYYGLRFTGNWLRKLGLCLPLSRQFATEVQEAIKQRGVTHVWLYDAHWVLYRKVIDVCRQADVPVVAHLTEWWRFASDPFRNHYYGQVLFHRLSLSKMSGVVGISTPFIKLARDRGIQAILVPVPGPPEADTPPALPASSSISGGGFTFFYTGVLQQRDMPEAMLEAMRSLTRQKANIRLVVSGKNGLYPEGRAFVQAVAADPALQGCVTFTGYLPNEEFRKQRAAADGFLLLHDDSWESRACFPTRLSEFMCAGKPVIVSGVGDIPLYARDGKDAVVLPPNNQAEALTAAMLRLARNPVAAASLGVAGRERALEVFSRVKLGAQLKDFLAEIVHKKT